MFCGCVKSLPCLARLWLWSRFCVLYPAIHHLTISCLCFIRCGSRWRLRPESSCYMFNPSTCPSSHLCGSPWATLHCLWWSIWYIISPCTSSSSSCHIPVSVFAWLFWWQSTTAIYLVSVLLRHNQHVIKVRDQITLYDLAGFVSFYRRIVSLAISAADVNRWEITEATSLRPTFCWQ